MVRFCDKKQFWWIIVIPVPSLIAYFFRDQKFSDRQKGSSTNFFSTLKQKILKKIVILSPSTPPSLIYKTSRYQTFCETEKGSSTNCFVTVTKKNLMENRNIRSSLPLTCLIPEKFRKTEKFLCHFLRHAETQIFDRKTWYSLPPLRPLLFITIFDTRHFLRQKRVPLLDESVVWHKILLTENCDIRPLSDL